METKGSAIHPTNLAALSRTNWRRRSSFLSIIFPSLSFSLAFTSVAASFAIPEMYLSSFPAKSRPPRGGGTRSEFCAAARSEERGLSAVGRKHDARTRFGVRELKVATDFSFKSSPDVLASKLGSNPRLGMLITGQRASMLYLELPQIKSLALSPRLASALINYFNTRVSYSRYIDIQKEQYRKINTRHGQILSTVTPCNPPHNFILIPRNSVCPS